MRWKGSGGCVLCLLLLLLLQLLLLESSLSSGEQAMAAMASDRRLSLEPTWPV